MPQWILASDGQPFRDRDAALIKRDLLVSELGAAVELQVLPHPSGGFAVSVDRAQIACPAHESLEAAAARHTASDPEAYDSPRETLLRSFGRTDARAASRTQGESPARSVADARRPTLTKENDSPATASNSYPESFRLSPTARAFLGLHLQALLGGLLLFQPHLVFIITGLGMPANPTVGAILLGGIAVCGALLAFLGLSRFLWTYTANTYVIDRNGVEQVQWYFERGRLRRRAPRVNFAHLRGVDVDQSVLQMMLNVGTLRLASGATDNYEVVLHHISAPRALQREFQHRLHCAVEPAQRPRISQDL